MFKSYWIYPRADGTYHIHKSNGILRGMGGLGYLEKEAYGYCYRIEVSE